MSTPECIGHAWQILAVEVAGAEVWTEEVCRRCGDERVTRPGAVLTAAALAAAS
jgi:hypothetical protein